MQYIRSLFTYIFLSLPTSIAMCGIVCVVALQGASPESRPKTNGHIPNSINGHNLKHDDYGLRLAKEIDGSLDMIDHRGPDSRGQWISDDKRVGTRPLIRVSLAS